jgi:hypothetical protein
MSPDGELFPLIWTRLDTELGIASNCEFMLLNGMGLDFLGELPKNPRIFVAMAKAMEKMGAWQLVQEWGTAILMDGDVKMRQVVIANSC